MPSTVTLRLRIARDDPSNDAIAFETNERQRITDREGNIIERTKWNWVARSHIQKIEPVQGDNVNVTMTKWVADKKGML